MFTELGKDVELISGMGHGSGGVGFTAVLGEVVFIFIFFGVAFLTEEAHVLGKVGKAGEGAGITGCSGVDAYGCGEVFGLCILG